MKTRTLMLLAFGCGVAIILAGAVFLFQLRGQDEIGPPVPLGVEVTVGDMQVVVESVDEHDALLDVTLRVSGVADDEGTAGFRLLAHGQPVDQHDAGDAGCATLTVAPQVCVVRFDVSGAGGPSRVLFYERGDDRVRWTLG